MRHDTCTRFSSLMTRRGRGSGSIRRLTLEPLESRQMLAVLPAGFVETPVASGISRATAMEVGPNGDVWVLEQGGAVKRFAAGSTTGDVVGNLSNLGLSSVGERGVLGIAFDPQYAANKYVFIYYTATAPLLHNRISRFQVNDTDPADYYLVGTSTAVSDAGSAGTPAETVIFDLDPLSGATNHNGGAIHFGPDGKLYVAVGDNANGSHAQSLATTHGKMLRINADGTIPGDNPFFASTSGNNRAIWALGLRNPFTFAFQPASGRMFINDVGQVTWEEINDGLAGANYGWPSVEGNEGTPPAGPGTYQGPTYAYSHGSGTFQGFAITGGAFYNPAVSQFPAQYAGDYFFADFVSNWINVLDIPTGVVERFASDASSPVDLRVTPEGSLLYLARGSGQVMRVSFASPPNQPPTISDLPNQSLLVDGSGTVGFTISDPDIAADLLSVNVTSDNDLLFPPGSLTVVAGDGGVRTLEIRPAAGASGTARVTVTVSDGSLTASDQLTIAVWGGEHPWHNNTRPEDVDGDGAIAPGDALAIINLINAARSGPLPRPPQEPAAPPFYDVVPDDYLAPIDALIVINFINRAHPSLGGGEAESEAAADAGGGKFLTHRAGGGPQGDESLYLAAGGIEAPAAKRLKARAGGA